LINIQLPGKVFVILLWTYWSSK